MGINMPQLQQRSSPLARLAELMGVVKGGMDIYQGAKESGRKSDEQERSDAMRRRAEDPNSAESKQARAEYSSFLGGPIAETASKAMLEQEYGPTATYAMKQYENKLGISKDAAREAENRKTELAKARGAKPPKGFQYAVNPETGREELRPTLTKLPSDKVLSINEGNSIPRTLEDIKASLKGSEAMSGPIIGRARSMNPWDTGAQSLDAQLRAASQQFGRYMEGGVLRKEDEDKYRKMFPQISDTPEVQEQKLNIVARLLAQRQGSNIEALRTSGYDVAGLDQKIPIPENPVTAKRPDNGLIPEALADNKPSFTVEDLMAMDWAKKNQNDPRAAQIISKLKGKGLQ